MPEFVKVNCIECGEGFEREKKRGRPQVRCNSCRTTNTKKLADGVVSSEVQIDGVTWLEAADPCRDCGQTFLRPKKRGKPPVRCADCREKAEQIVAEEVSVPQERLEELFTGSKTLLQGTPDQLPKGAEAQCPGIRGCGRIFTSDTACERHKTYGANGNLAGCKDPASLGMEPRERRGVPVWTTPSSV